jgi:hypothetical protein
MKKIILKGFIFCLLSKITYSQNLIKHIDTMNDKVYFIFDKRISLIDKEQKKGFAIDLFVASDGKRSDTEGNPVVEGITTTSVNIGTCNENDELIILFDDDSKIKLISFNDFNCEGKSYYKLDQNEYEALKTKKIKRSRFTNGKSYDSFTMDLDVAKQGYFINAINAVENRIFTIEKE